MKVLIGLIAILAIPTLAIAGAFPVGSSWGPEYVQGGDFEFDGVVSAIGYQSEIAETGQETVTEYNDLYQPPYQMNQQVTPFVGLLMPCGATSTGSGIDSSGNSYLNFTCSCPAGRCGGSFCCTNPGNHALKAWNYQNFQTTCPTTTSTGCYVKLDGHTLTTGY